MVRELEIAPPLAAIIIRIVALKLQLITMYTAFRVIDIVYLLVQNHKILFCFSLQALTQCILFGLLFVQQHK